MATTIKLKNGSGAPLAGDLVQGEPALDLTNKRLYTENASGTVIEVGTNPSTLTVDTTTLVVDATNNRVGVGTASPAQTLHVNSGATNEAARFESTDTEVTLELKDTTGTAKIKSRADFRFETGATPSEAMRIDSSGNVGIGTASPSRTLDIQGNSSTNIPLVVRSGSGQTNGFIAINDPNTTSEFNNRIGSVGDNMVFHTSGVEKVRIDSSGNVLVNKTVSDTLGTAGHELHNSGMAHHTRATGTVLYLNRTGNDGTIVDFRKDNTTVGSIGSNSSGGNPLLDINAATSGSSLMRFTTSGTERMRINSAGEIQIGGTTNAGFVDFDSVSLQLNTQRNPNTGSFVNTGKSHASLALAGSNGGSHIRFATASANNTTATERMRIDSSGNVGIGTTSPVVSSGYNSLTINDTTSGYLVLQNNGTTKMEAYVSGGTEATLRGTGVPLAFVTTAAHEMTFDTYATERMRIASGGNVGIGTSSPSANAMLHVHKSDTNRLYLTSTSNAIQIIGDPGNTGMFIDNESDAASDIVFRNTSAYSERMRIDSSGNLLVGTTSNPSSGKIAIDYARGTSAGMRIKDTVGSGGTGVIADFYNSSNTSMGAITHDSSNITYGGTSDYRLKENINYEFDGLTAVSKLKPATFTWVNNPNVGVIHGFIAHEVSDVLAHAVVGEKDAINDDGTIKPQMLDQSKLIPLLTKAIQELSTQVNELKAEVAALKGA